MSNIIGRVNAKGTRVRRDGKDLIFIDEYGEIYRIWKIISFDNGLIYEKHDLN